jgi:hypothetical protein
VAQEHSLIPKSRLTPIAPPPRSQAHLVREAIEPSGEGPFADAMREWIEVVSSSPRRVPLHIVR